MLQEVETVRIPSQEYRAITDLMHAHYDAHQGKLRALIAFGELVTSGNTFDIDLLEVVAGWQEPGLAAFSSSSELPLRGRLRLYLISSRDFEDPLAVSDPAQKQWVIDLLSRVHQGYEIVLEDPPGYAIRELAHGVPLSPPSSSTGVFTNGDPLRFLNKGNGRGTRI